MYRLPSQFDPSGRQDDLSAAGGGSTSTSCCSCVVTLAAASAITARHFAHLEPTPVPAPEATDRPYLPVSRPEPMSPLTRGLWGASALVLAALAGAIGSMLIPMFGIFTGLAAYIGIFCMVYDRSRRSAKRGALMAVLTLVAIVACAAGELIVWISTF